MNKGTEILTCSLFLCVTVHCLLLGRRVLGALHFLFVGMYDLLFSLLDEFPVSYVLDIEDHVSTKHKLL
jgi:hypothetical protein